MGKVSFAFFVSPQVEQKEQNRSCRLGAQLVNNTLFIIVFHRLEEGNVFLVRFSLVLAVTYRHVRIFFLELDAQSLTPVLLVLLLHLGVMEQVLLKFLCPPGARERISPKSSMSCRQLRF
jgi:hypothetical protein